MLCRWDAPHSDDESGALAGLTVLRSEYVLFASVDKYYKRAGAGDADWVLDSHLTPIKICFSEKG